MAQKSTTISNGFFSTRSPYDETVTILGSASSPVTITLPNTGSYTGLELRIDLNGQLLKPADYNFIGSEPRTQVEILQDLSDGDEVRFYKQ